MGKIILITQNSRRNMDLIVGEKLNKYLQKNGSKSKVLPVSHEFENEVVLEAPNEIKEEDSRKGIIVYALSNRSFIEKGWTELPTVKVVKQDRGDWHKRWGGLCHPTVYANRLYYQINVYRMRPAHLEFDWFEHNKKKRLMKYDTGEKLAEIDENGRGRWFYRNGRVALDYYDAEDLHAGQRFVVYSSGEPDERGRGRPYTLLATFDYAGNGIVFDQRGKIRLKYNQTEGEVLDRSIGPISHWKWHSLNDPPVLKQVMIDTQIAYKDPDILQMGKSEGNEKPKQDNEEMLAIEFDNLVKENIKKQSQSYEPFQIKMKALKINENFSLRVLDQATVYLKFRDGTTSLKLNIGMVLDQKEIVDTDTAEVGEVSSSMERLPARTDSLAGLQKSVAIAQHYDRMRTERQQKLYPCPTGKSIDELVAGITRPLRPPLQTMLSRSTATTTAGGKCSRKTEKYYSCRSKKPTASNGYYYDARL